MAETQTFEESEKSEKSRESFATILEAFSRVEAMKLWMMDVAYRWNKHFRPRTKPDFADVDVEDRGAYFQDFDREILPIFVPALAFDDFEAAVAIEEGAAANRRKENERRKEEEAKRQEQREQEAIEKWASQRGLRLVKVEDDDSDIVGW